MRWAALGDGWRVEAAIVIDEARGALLVPELALFRTGEVSAVYVNEAGVARLRRLRIGRRNGVDVEALGGVRVEERVVLHPGERITEGARIEAR